MSTVANPTPAGPEREPEGLLVDPGFQSRALLPVLLFAGLYALLLLLVVFMPLDSTVAQEPDLGVRSILRGNFDEFGSRLWLVLGVAGLVSAYISFYWSLRVIRPAYRVHYALKEMVEGEYKPLRFRRGEEFRFFEDDLAQINQKMKLIATRNRDILLAVHSQVRKLADRLAADEIIPRADLEEVVRAMLAQLEKASELTPVARR